MGSKKIPMRLGGLLKTVNYMIMYIPKPTLNNDTTHTPPPSDDDSNLIKSSKVCNIF